MKFDVVTIFPQMVSAPLREGVLGRAIEKGLLDLGVHDLRAFTDDRHHVVDDVAYGGGPGMVMKPEPFFEAIDSLRPVGPIVLLSARGRLFTHADAVRYSVHSELTLLCGHYKDVDQRVADHLATEEVSLGDFVLSGGEIAALAITDAVVRLLPGAMGDHDSAATDSFYDEGRLSPPSYTRPAEYRGYKVPDLLRSGDHARIEAWRLAEGERLTRERRPELTRDTGDDEKGEPGRGVGKGGGRRG
jgi:tRNA (guanine37-N1)-methyltransferase